jgi:hypothetical protein
MLGLSPIVTAGLLTAAVAGVGAFSYSQGISSRDSKIGQNFERALMREREVAVRREVNLWTQVGDERRARVEMIETFQRVDQASLEARAKYQAALARERSTAKAALDEAMTNIEDLKNATSVMAKNWKDGVVPDDITCGVFNAQGCGAPAYPATSADPGDGVEVRDGPQPAAPGKSP